MCDVMWSFSPILVAVSTTLSNKPKLSKIQEHVETLNPTCLMHPDRLSGGFVGFPIVVMMTGV